MLVKTLFNLQPSEHPAHSLVVLDDKGNPLFVAMHLTDSIVYSDVSQPDFANILKLVGVEEAPSVTFSAKN